MSTIFSSQFPEPDLNRNPDRIARKRLKLRTRKRLMAPGQEAKQAEEHHDEDQGQGDETIARHALLVTQRTQSLNIARSQIVDKLWIGRGRAAEMLLDSIGQFHEVKLARAHVVVMAGGGQRFGSVFERLLVHALKDRLGVRRAVGGAGGR